MRASRAPPRAMRRSARALWSVRVLAVAAAIAVTAGAEEVGALSSPPADSMKAQQRSNSKSELWKGQHQQVLRLLQESTALDVIPTDRRKALRNEDARWPKATIPYYIMPSIYKLSSSAPHMIKDAMKHWENETCVRFVPVDIEKDRDAIFFKEGDWCNSIPGRRGGWQPVNLASGCLKVGSVIHELGHVIGWVHEHARPDRDQYLEIIWKKVRDADTSQYEKYNDSYINTFGVRYDYGSIMHYNGSSGTIRALDPKKQKLMGQRVRLSFYDAKLANLMYKCAERNKCDLASIKCVGEGYVGPRCSCVCPDGYDRCAVESRLNGPATTLTTNK